MIGGGNSCIRDHGGPPRQEQVELRRHEKDTLYRFSNNDADLTHITDKDQAFSQGLIESVNRMRLLLPKDDRDFDIFSFSTEVYSQDSLGNIVPVQMGYKIRGDDGKERYKLQIDVDSPKKVDNGPNGPHLGYTLTPCGREKISENRANKTVGHILLNEVPATRYRDPDNEKPKGWIYGVVGKTRLFLNKKEYFAHFNDPDYDIKDRYPGIPPGRMLSYKFNKRSRDNKLPYEKLFYG